MSDTARTSHDDAGTMQPSTLRLPYRATGPNVSRPNVGQPMGNRATGPNVGQPNQPTADSQPTSQPADQPADQPNGQPASPSIAARIREALGAKSKIGGGERYVSLCGWSGHHTYMRVDGDVLITPQDGCHEGCDGTLYTVTIAGETFPNIAAVVYVPGTFAVSQNWPTGMDGWHDEKPDWWSWTSVGTDTCTGDATTCPIGECVECGERDCPHGEPLHYHHDGCPACFTGGPEPEPNEPNTGEELDEMTGYDEELAEWSRLAAERDAICYPPTEREMATRIEELTLRFEMLDELCDRTHQRLMAAEQELADEKKLTEAFGHIIRRLMREKSGGGR